MVAATMTDERSKHQQGNRSSNNGFEWQQQQHHHHHQDSNSKSYQQDHQQQQDTVENLKLFIGQIPRDLDEEGLQKILGEYGKIKELVVLRDRHGLSRGCAFCTFSNLEEANHAVQALHQNVVLDGMGNALQVKFADVATEKPENKLFVGMIPLHVAEADLKQIFSQYGSIKEVALLRNSSTGVSRGCAFIKFVERSSAEKAVEAVNGKMRLTGSKQPLVVKFAYSGREKQLMRAKQQQENGGLSGKSGKDKNKVGGGRNGASSARSSSVSGNGAGPGQGGAAGGTSAPGAGGGSVPQGGAAPGGMPQQGGGGMYANQQMPQVGGFMKSKSASLGTYPLPRSPLLPSFPTRHPGEQTASPLTHGGAVPAQQHHHMQGASHHMGPAPNMHGHPVSHPVPIPNMHHPQQGYYGHGGGMMQQQPQGGAQHHQAMMNNGGYMPQNATQMHLGNAYRDNSFGSDVSDPSSAYGQQQQQYYGQFSHPMMVQQQQQQPAKDYLNQQQYLFNNQQQSAGGSTGGSGIPDDQTASPSLSSVSSGNMGSVASGAIPLGSSLTGSGATWGANKSTAAGGVGSGNQNRPWSNSETSAEQMKKLHHSFSNLFCRESRSNTMTDSGTDPFGFGLFDANRADRSQSISDPIASGSRDKVGAMGSPDQSPLLFATALSGGGGTPGGSSFSAHQIPALPPPSSGSQQSKFFPEASLSGGGVVTNNSNLFDASVDNKVADFVPGSVSSVTSHDSLLFPNQFQFDHLDGPASTSVGGGHREHMKDLLDQADAVYDDKRGGASDAMASKTSVIGQPKSAPNEQAGGKTSEIGAVGGGGTTAKTTKVWKDIVSDGIH